VTPQHPAQSAGPALPVWIGGRLVAHADAMVSALDAGLRSGWGVFETLRAQGSTTLALAQHLERLGAGAQRLGIPFDHAEVERALRTTLAAPRSVDEVVVRVTLTAGPLDPDGAWPPALSGPPTLVVTLHRAPSLPLAPAHAVTVEARRWPADVKTTSYVASILAMRQARAAGAEVAVLADGDELLETAEGNLFALIDGLLLTPPDDGRMLAGITRGLVLEAAAALGLPTRIRTLRRADVAGAEALAVSSSVVGLRSVLSLDGIALRGATVDVEHPVIVRLRAQLLAAFA